MPPKKKGGGKKKKGKAIDLTEHGFIPASVGDGFFKVCNEMGLDPEVTKPQASALRHVLEPNETTPYHTRLSVEHMPLGPGGIRALCWSLLGLTLSLQPAYHHHDKKNGKDANKETLSPLLTASYRPLTELCFNECRCGDGGAVAISHLLNPKAVERGVTLTTLCIRGDRVTYIGVEAISVSLSWNSPLQKLSLDYMPELDDAAVRILCHGLMLNGTLKDLSLSFGGYGPDSMGYLSQLIASPKSVLSALSLKGNYLGPEGLLELSPGIAATLTLESLDLSACGLGRPIFVRSSKASLHAKSEVLDAWAVFVGAIHANLFSSGSEQHSEEIETGGGGATEEELPHVPQTSKKGKKKKGGGGGGGTSDGRIRLKKLDLLENNLLPEQGELLSEFVPAKSPLSVLKVDITLPDLIFKDVWRGEVGGGKKKGKKGKKKK